MKKNIFSRMLERVFFSFQGTHVKVQMLENHRYVANEQCVKKSILNLMYFGVGWYGSSGFLLYPFPISASALLTFACLC